MDRNKAEFLDFIKDVDIVFSNKPELHILFGSKNTEVSTKKLMNMVKYGCVTGKKGLLFLIIHKFKYFCY